MKNLFLVIAALLLGGCSASTQSRWELVWEEDFNQSGQIDTTVWSKIPRTYLKPDWRKYMSDHEDCYAIADGHLILRGIRNLDAAADTATYLTGGLYTKYKRSFHFGRLEIKAKLQGARGAWPAIWLKPYEEEKYPWPSGGEIDIMERLNYDTIAYQTVHSNYTVHLGLKEEPPHGSTAAIRPDDYNVYGVEMYPDSLVFFINDKKNFTYPRISTDREDQYPFDIPYYLLIDMQLGGSWVGEVDPADLPVEMTVDWVRYYQLRQK